MQAWVSSEKPSHCQDQGGWKGIEETLQGYGKWGWAGKRDHRWKSGSNHLVHKTIFQILGVQNSKTVCMKIQKLGPLCTRFHTVDIVLIALTEVLARKFELWYLPVSNYMQNSQPLYQVDL